MKDLEFAKSQDINGDWSWGNQFAGIKMNSNYFVFDIMSRLIDENPQIRLINEFGTHTGTFATYLGLEGVRKKITVITWEIQKQVSEETNNLLALLSVNQEICDVFAERDRIIEIVSAQPTYLICDGGDKQAEALIFGAVLPSGSIMSIHDWGQEVTYQHLEPIWDKIIPIRPEEWGLHNCQFASFRIK